MGEVHHLRSALGTADAMRILSQEEEDRLLGAICKRSHRYYHFSVFLTDTGARPSEAVAVKWTDLNGRVVRFRQSKLAVERSLPLTERAARSVHCMLESVRGPYSSIRLHDYGTVWKEAKEEVGLNERVIVPGILRHTCAYRLVRAGLDLQLVQKWLGHKSLAMTMRYTESVDLNLQSCARILERFSSGSVERPKATVPTAK